MNIAHTATTTMCVFMSRGSLAVSWLFITYSPEHLTYDNDGGSGASAPLPNTIAIFFFLRETNQLPLYRSSRLRRLRQSLVWKVTIRVLILGKWTFMCLHEDLVS